jgi:hypothetical protein
LKISVSTFGIPEKFKLSDYKPTVLPSLQHSDYKKTGQTVEEEKEVKDGVYKKEKRVEIGSVVRSEMNQFT